MKDDERPKNTRRNNSRSKKRSQEAEQAESAKGDEKAETSANVIPLNELPKVSYNVQEVERFLDTVFHAGLEEGEEIITYFGDASKGKIHRVWGSKEDAFLTRLSRTSKAAALYTSTSTFRAESDGTLHNKKANFVSFRVLLLDDIGTKVPIENIPEAAQPTTIIESSKGNYQYGYVLEEPITDFKIANTYMRLFHDSRDESEKITDTGGVQVTKRIRLPEGVHGKANSTDIMFRTKLVECDGPVYTAQKLLDVFGVAVDFADVELNPTKYDKSCTATAVTAWTPIKEDYATLEGYVDTPLEYYAEAGGVIGEVDAQGWIPIVCPRHTEHSDGDRTAYYSPVGYGGDEYKLRRQFNCFHEHGGEPPTTRDFLDYIAKSGGPRDVPINDPAADLVRKYVFDTGNSTVWCLNDRTPPFAYKSKKAFEEEFNGPIEYNTIDRRSNASKMIVKTAPVSSFFDRHPQRLVVRGAVHDKRSTARIVCDSDGNNFVNMYQAPHFGHGKIDQAHVDKFINYIETLIPNPEESAVFIDWLAAKVQDPTFRGWGMVMHTPTTGTGRGTLIKMLMQIFEPHNCITVPFGLFKKEADFNEHQMKSLCFVNESSTDTQSTLSYSQAGIVRERIKEEIDTTPTFTSINQKYGVKLANVQVTTSYLIATNNVLQVVNEGDRRLYIIENPLTPPPAEFFTQTHEWLNEGSWRNSVGRYLLKREVDFAFLNGRAPTTAGKKEITNTAASPLDVMMNSIYTNVEHAFLTSEIITAIVLDGGLESRLNLPPSANPAHIVRKAFDNSTASAFETVLRVNPIKNPNGPRAPRRVRYVPSCPSDLVKKLNALKSGPKPSAKDLKHLKDAIRDVIESIDIQKLKAAVISALDTEGF